MGKGNDNGNFIAKVVGAILAVIVLVVIVILLIKGCVGKQYEVSFDTQGGSAITALKVNSNGTIEKPSDPVKEGYTFGGWYYNDEEFDFNTKITSDIVLEARWVPINESSSITLDTTSHSLKIGSKDKLTATLTGEAKGSELVWTSSNDDVVKVDENGNIEALKVGSATITVTTKDGKYKATCKVTVVEETVNVESVTLTGAKEVTVGNTIKLTATVKPKDATNKKVTYKSSDTKVATVDANGRVKGIKAGQVTITVTTADGEKTATITITVKENQVVKVTGVKITNKKTSLTVGETYTLKATVSPDNATNKSVKWTSSNPDVITVDTNGKLTAKKAGKATITVTTTDGSKTDKVEITVNEASKPVVEKTYKVTFKTDNNTTFKTVDVKEGKTVSNPGNPTKKYYDFVEWVDKDGKKYDFSKAVNDNITLTAKWEKAYTYTVENIPSTVEGQEEQQKKVKVFYGEEDISATVVYVCENENLQSQVGKYVSKGYIAVDKSATNKINYVKHNGDFHKLRLQ